MKSIKLNMTFILEEMKRKKLTRQQLATNCGITYATLSRAIREETTSVHTAECLEQFLGEGVYAEDTNDPFGLIARLKEAQSAGNLYILRHYGYMFQVGIEHPDGSFVVRHTSSLREQAEKAVERFNRNPL